MSIQALLQAKLSGPVIARQLTLSRSTINREINRSKATPTALPGAYQAGPAQVRRRGLPRAAAGCPAVCQMLRLWRGCASACAKLPRQGWPTNAVTVRRVQSVAVAVQPLAGLPGGLSERLAE